MFALGILLLVLYVFFRHPVFLSLGALLIVVALVLALAGGFSHYAYF